MWLYSIPPFSLIKRSNVLLSSLIMLMALLSLMFIAWDNENLIWRSDLSQQEHYLTDKWHFSHLNEHDWQTQCQHAQQNYVFFAKKQLKIRAECVRYRFFIRSVPTKKYLQIKQFSDVIDLERFGKAVHIISHLNDLPNTSLETPKIVQFMQPIDGRLTQDFYGIILTEYPFHITDKKIYGMLISTTDNVEMGQKRNLTFKREIVNYFDHTYQQWHFLPHSLRIVGYD